MEAPPSVTVVAHKELQRFLFRQRSLNGQEGC